MKAEWTEVMFLQIRAGQHRDVRLRAVGRERLPGPGGALRELALAAGGDPGGADVPALLAPRRAVARAGTSNIFVQIGLVVLVGLACKNAILIVEYAKQKHIEGLVARRGDPWRHAGCGCGRS